MKLQAAKALLGLSMKEIKPIEQYVIDAVRNRRKELGISQAKLANMIGVSQGFIGNVENPKYIDKYNLAHLNEIARALGCSPRDFLPDGVV